MKTWLVIDVSYMCHRAWHTTGDLSWKGRATGVLFGFLKSIGSLKDQFATDNIAFCFESYHLFRRDAYPAYKRHRHTKVWTKAEEQAYRTLHEQIDALYKIYLPRIGFKNIFCEYGYESDDLMAAIAHECPDSEEVVLVTSDSDLYQCLRDNVSIYSPQKQKLFTKDWFYRTYGIWPPQWSLVKAMAGCHTDEVAGIPGIGEKTAIKYCQGKLPFKSKAYRTIMDGKSVVWRNKLLVKLPHPNCRTPVLTEDSITREGWRDVCGQLGMRSLAGQPPVTVRRLPLLKK